MANSPEFRAFSRAKGDLVRQLSFTLTFLKDECRASDPQLLSFDEDQAIFGGHGSTSVQETSKLMDVVLTRIRFNPDAYHTFRNLRAVCSGANKPLALLMDRLLAEEMQRQIEPVTRAMAVGAVPPAVYNHPVHHTHAPPTSHPMASHTTCSLDDYLHSIRGAGVVRALDREVTEMDQAFISQSIANWQELLPFFGLSEVDRSTILGNNPHSVEVQRREMLVIWHSRRGRRRATYRGLAACFYNAGQRELVERVVEVLGYEAPPWPDPPQERAAVVAARQPVSRPVQHVYPTRRPTMKELMKLLYQEVSHKWYDIGAFLEIRTPELEGIKDKNLNDPKKCLLTMLGMWLVCDDPPPSWEAMAEALEIVGREDIARKIETTLGP